VDVDRGHDWFYFVLGLICFSPSLPLSLSWCDFGLDNAGFYDMMGIRGAKLTGMIPIYSFVASA
jgi:hypothetical protein